VGEIKLDEQPFSDLAISKDNSLVAFSTYQGKIEVWDVKRKRSMVY
jgi:hypothetical protein